MEVIHRHLETDRLVICPLGDIQYDGSERTDIKRLREIIAEVIERDGKFAGLGDFCDFLSPSNRQRLLAAALYDQAREAIDRAALGMVDELIAEALEPTRGRWLAMVHGHHYHVTAGGIHSDQYLADRLEAPYAGTSALVVVTLSGAPEPLRIFLHHGWTSARTIAGEAPELERTAAAIDADILLVGHSHKLRAYPIAQLAVREAEDGRYRLVAKPRFLVQCGSFAKHWTEGSQFAGLPQGTYAEQRGLRPTVLGAPIIEVRPDYDDRGVFRWRLRVLMEV